MSRLWGGLLLAAVSAVAGCCGGGPSHKCDFTPPDQPGKDAATDGPLPCGTQICDPSQVCCVKKAPLVAFCVAPEEFLPQGCEQFDLPCAVPADCPGNLGLVCCFHLAPAVGVSCLPPQVCPGDGANTYLVCDDDSQCPRIGSTCVVLGTAEDGTKLRGCTP